jgi:hypothetical protein
MQGPKLTAVEEGEREVDEELLAETFACRVVLLDDVVDLADGRRDEEREDKGENVPVARPEEDVDGVAEGSAEARPYEDSYPRW